MATFSVPNGTGIDSNNDSIGDGVKFGQLSLVASSGILGVPLITPTTGNVTFNDFGSMILAGTGMSFTLPGTFTGTVESLTYTKLLLPVFAIAGMSVPLATVAGLLLGGGNEETILGTIFAGADQIEGSSMPDILKGYAGNDTIIGGAGADTIDGGDGTDVAGYFNSGFGVIVDLGTGIGGSSDAAGDVLINIENLGGSTFDDTLTGNAGANLLNGGGGMTSSMAQPGPTRSMAATAMTRSTAATATMRSTAAAGASSGTSSGVPTRSTAAPAMTRSTAAWTPMRSMAAPVSTSRTTTAAPTG